MLDERSLLEKPCRNPTEARENARPAFLVRVTVLIIYS